MPKQLRKHRPASVHPALLLSPNDDAYRQLRRSNFKSFPLPHKSINYVISSLR
jgi:hypothetical protein